MAREKLLITKDDIAQYVDVGLNIDGNRIDRAIQDAQIFDLRAFLGDPLYLDFIDKVFKDTDPLFTLYQELLKGTDYTFRSNTIKFYGLKPLLVFWAWGRFSKFGNIKSTRAGLKLKTTEQSAQPSDSMISTMVIDSRSKAGVYLNDARQFLDEKNSDYPLWNDAGDRQVQKTKGVKFSRLQPHTKDGQLIRPRFNKLADED